MCRCVLVHMCISPIFVQTHRKQGTLLVIVTSDPLSLCRLDEISLADLLTFVLCVVEEEEYLGVLREYVINFVDYEVEVVYVDG